jgi:hypothetical protein
MPLLLGLLHQASAHDQEDVVRSESLLHPPSADTALTSVLLPWPVYPL